MAQDQTVIVVIIIFAYIELGNIVSYARNISYVYRDGSGLKGKLILSTYIVANNLNQKHI